MKQKIPNRSGFPIGKYRKYEVKKELADNAVKRIDSLISKGLYENESAQNLSSLFAIKKNYQAELDALHEPVSFRPFFNNRIPYYWFINYFSLLVLVFIVSPIKVRMISFKSTFIIAIILHILYSCFNWLRNFVFFDEGRLLFSYAHFDISPMGFFFQEFQFLGLCALIAITWNQSDVYLADNIKYTNKWKADSHFSLIELNNASRYVYSLFLHWQISSILLVGGFFIWTFHFWNLAFELGDTRYYISAIIMHLFWLVSWIIISRPLIIVMIRWNLLKSKLQALLSQTPENFKNPERSLEYITQLNPLSAYQLFGTSIAAIGSFLLPFIDLVKKL